LFFAGNRRFGFACAFISMSRFAGNIFALGPSRAPVRNRRLNCFAQESRDILAIDDKFEHDIDSLIEVGKEKGYLTYGDVNDMRRKSLAPRTTWTT